MSDTPPVARVSRTREQARASYDRLSGTWDLVSGRFEAPHRAAGLELLAARAGEQVLELGFGTGACAVALGQAVGATGSVKALDLSPGMLAVASRRVREAGLEERVELVLGDAAKLPWDAGTFDAVFSSFVLELFDTPELPLVLAEWRRVLSDAGRLGLVSLVPPEAPTVASRLYGWAHRHLPVLVDCRPIPARALLEEAGFRVTAVRPARLAGLAVEALLAVRS